MRKTTHAILRKTTVSQVVYNDDFCKTIKRN